MITNVIRLSEQQADRFYPSRSSDDEWRHVLPFWLPSVPRVIRKWLGTAPNRTFGLIAEAHATAPGGVWVVAFGSRGEGPAAQWAVMAFPARPHLNGWRPRLRVDMTKGLGFGSNGLSALPKYLAMPDSRPPTACYLISRLAHEGPARDRPLTAAILTGLLTHAAQDDREVIEAERALLAMHAPILSERATRLAEEIEEVAVSRRLTAVPVMP